MRVLVIDDHPKLRANLRAFLRLQGIDSDEAVTGEEGLAKCRAHTFGAIVLDINMPVMDGREFLKILRSEWNDTPVIALTSDSLLSDKVKVFDLGADDYMTKPFESEELIARIRALLRRREKPIEARASISGLEVDYDRMQVLRDHENIELSAKEWWVFSFLAKNKGMPKSKAEILEVVWGETEENLWYDSVTLEAHISSLRKKLWKDIIRTIRNIGYVIDN